MADSQREKGALTVLNLNKDMNRAEALLAISIAILEVKDWFNVKGNMTDKQVKMTAELILDHPNFYDLSIGNIKACFREKMMSEKLYDRLDGNIIIGWLKQFKSDMADACYAQRMEQDRIERLKEEGEWKGIDINESTLINRDCEPRRPLDLLSGLPFKAKVKTKEEQEEWRKRFLKYKAERMINKNNK